MIKDAKLEDGKIPHVIGPSASGYYRFQASMNKKTAQRVSDVLTMLKKQFASATMSAAFCDAIEALEELWQLQSEIAHALEICDQADDSLDIIDWGGNEDCRRVAKKIIQDIRMALTGCLTNLIREFTGEKSQDYIERYGDE